MRLKRKLWAVTLTTLAISLIIVNMIYALVKAPNLKAKYLHTNHDDWCGQGLVSKFVQAGMQWTAAQKCMLQVQPS